MTNDLFRYSPNNLGRRTPGEKLWLARKAAGLTQVQAAKLAGVGENAYAAAERDLNDVVRGPVPGIPAVRRPTTAQLLALARRRDGDGLDALAAWVGWSKVTFLLKERSGNKVLKGYWEYLGFRFR